MMNNDNDLWNFVDGWFKEKLYKNEAVLTGHGRCLGGSVTIPISYARISDNKLFQSDYSIEKKVLMDMNEITVRGILSDILQRFRDDV